LSVPEAIRDLRSLEILRLTCNQLTSLPAWLGRLSALKKLYLAQNRLTTLPADLGNLGALLTLNLEDNQLINVPAELENLHALTRLYFTYNPLLTSVPAELGHLSALVVLGLDRDQLTSLPVEWEVNSISETLRMCHIFSSSDEHINDLLPTPQPFRQPRWTPPLGIAFSVLGLLCAGSGLIKVIQKRVIKCQL